MWPEKNCGEAPHAAVRIVSTALLALTCTRTLGFTRAVSKCHRPQEQPCQCYGGLRVLLKHKFTNLHKDVDVKGGWASLLCNQQGQMQTSGISTAHNAHEDPHSQTLHDSGLSEKEFHSLYKNTEASNKVRRLTTNLFGCVQMWAKLEDIPFKP